MLFSLVFVSHHPGRTTLQAVPLRNLRVRRLPRLGRGAENFLSFRSSLIPRHSPLTTKSFTIRTSKTPLPQLLYNPHLQTPLGSAGNKGLITPLESALTKNSPVTPVESALTKRWGVGVRVSRSAFWTPVKSRGLPPPEIQLRDVLHLCPFLATHPKNRLLTPIIATLPKPLFTSPLLATHPRSPGGCYG